MELRFWVARDFDSPSLSEVRKDSLHSAQAHVSEWRNVFHRHNCAEANDDPLNIFRDCFALSHGGDGTLSRLSFLFWKYLRRLKIKRIHCWMQMAPWILGCTKIMFASRRMKSSRIFYDVLQALGPSDAGGCMGWSKLECREFTIGILQMRVPSVVCTKNTST